MSNKEQRLDDVVDDKGTDGTPVKEPVTVRLDWYRWQLSTLANTLGHVCRLICGQEAGALCATQVDIWVNRVAQRARWRVTAMLDSTIDVDDGGYIIFDLWNELRDREGTRYLRLELGYTRWIE